MPQLLEGSLHSKVCSNLHDRSVQGCQTSSLLHRCCCQNQICDWELGFLFAGAFLSLARAPCRIWHLCHVTCPCSCSPCMATRVTSIHSQARGNVSQQARYPEYGPLPWLYTATLVCLFPKQHHFPALQDAGLCHSVSSLHPPGKEGELGRKQLLLDWDSMELGEEREDKLGIDKGGKREQEILFRQDHHPSQLLFSRSELWEIQRRYTSHKSRAKSTSDEGAVVCYKKLDKMPTK